MATRYNIYYAGQILHGHEPGEVRQRLAKVFNANENTLDKLFSGKQQLLKRDCDKATALKYKQAMEKAGAQPVIQAADAPAEPAPASPQQEPAATKKEPTAAERIAALAQAPDDDRYKQPSQPAAPTSAPPSPAAPPAPTAPRAYDGEVEPAGADILRSNERAKPVEPRQPPTNLSMGPEGERLAAPAEPAPARPSTAHLDMAETGELIPNLPTALEEVSPDTSGIVLSDGEFDLSDCAPPPAAAPDVDLSGMDIAPAGADVLEDKYRASDDVAAPSTDHISLSDSTP